MIEFKLQFQNRSEVLQSIKNLTNTQDCLTDLAINNGSTENILFSQREVGGIISKMLEQLEDYEESEGRKGKKE
jgi:hypothetical protein